MHRDVGQPLQKEAGSRSVPLLTQHRVQEIAVPVNGAVQVTPATADLHVGLIDVLGAAVCLAAAPGTQSFA